MTTVVFRADGQDDRIYPRHTLVCRDGVFLMYRDDDAQQVDPPEGEWRCAVFPDNEAGLEPEPSQPTPEPRYI